MAYSEKKSKVYYVIGYILFWYGLVGAISGVLLRQSLVSFWQCFFEISLFSWLASMLFRRSAKNLPEGRLKQRNLIKGYLPKVVFIVYRIGLIVFVILTLMLLLTPYVMKMIK